MAHISTVLCRIKARSGVCSGRGTETVLLSPFSSKWQKRLEHRDPRARRWGIQSRTGCTFQSYATTGLAKPSQITMVLAVVGGYCPINGSVNETPRKNNMKTAKTLPVYDATISSQDPHFTDEDTEVPRDQEPGLKSQAWEGPARAGTQSFNSSIQGSPTYSTSAANRSRSEIQTHWNVYSWESKSGTFSSYLKIKFIWGNN